MRKILSVGDFVTLRPEYKLAGTVGGLEDLVFEIYNVQIFDDNDYNVLDFDDLCEKLRRTPSLRLHAKTIYNVRDIKRYSNHSFYDYRVLHCNREGIIYNVNPALDNRIISVF